MGLLLGMDEAGYGPNLGPLVVTVTVWATPSDPRDCDLWTCLSDAVAQCPDPDDTRLHVADSKDVYSTRRGLGTLERSVRAALEFVGIPTGAFEQLAAGLTAWHCRDDLNEPWMIETPLALPICDECSSPELDEHVGLLRECCSRCDVRLLGVHSDIVSPARFNRTIESTGNKSTALSLLSLNLLRAVWDPGGCERSLVVADKHGGRNRYHEFLAEVLDGRLFFTAREGRDVSSYRFGNAEIRFQSKAEEHLPVALASMVGKYVRELSMELFNRYWKNEVPGLKPTRGYPTDARRFRTDIAQAQHRLGIADEILWRVR